MKYEKANNQQPGEKERHYSGPFFHLFFDNEENKKFPITLKA